MRRFLLPLVLAAALPLAGATIDVRVQNARGNAVRDAVVYAVPEGRQVPAARNRTAVMDQRNRMFVPHVLPVQTGTAVEFPNSDDVRHHVYSFSPAKPFQLPLYKGTPANPEHFEKAGSDGKATLKDLDAGRYTVRVWYADMRAEPRPETITVKSEDRVHVSFR
jgi:plastocyanin